MAQLQIGEWGWEQEQEPRTTKRKPKPKPSDWRRYATAPRPDSPAAPVLDWVAWAIGFGKSTDPRKIIRTLARARCFPSEDQIEKAIDRLGQAEQTNPTEN